ncbi:hypothetical protein [Sphingomonas oryzagri]
MKKAAVEKAEARVKAAQTALTNLEAIKISGTVDQAAFAAAWFAYLTAWKAVYTTLEQGAKGNQSSEQWFAKAKQARIDDRLLSYLYYARNDEEHGLEPTSGYAAGEYLFKVTGGAQYTSTTGPDGKPVFIGPDGKPAELLSESGPGFILTTVRKPNGKEVGAPIAHKDAILADMSPLGVAKLGLDHIIEIVAEARALL